MDEYNIYARLPITTLRDMNNTKNENEHKHDYMGMNYLTIGGIYW